MSSKEWLDRARRSQFLVVDVETNGKDVREPGSGAYVQGLSLTFRDKDGIQSEYFALNHMIGENTEKFLQGEIVDVINNHPCLIEFNAKFDNIAMGLLGVVRKGQFYCVQAMAHFVNENLTKLWSLDNVCRLLGIPGKNKSPEMQRIIDNFGWGHIPAEMMRGYGTNDGIITLLAFEKLYARFAAEGFVGKLWFDEQEFIMTLAKMECFGVRIDTEFCQQEIRIGEMRKLDIYAELDMLKPTSPKDLEVLLLRQMKLPVFKTTPGGKPSFDKFAMREYDAVLETRNDRTAKLIVEYRGWDKTVSSNYRAYLELLGKDGRLRCNYKNTGTKTSRTSCEKPNLQQIPKASVKRWNGHLKDAFIPEYGYTLWEIDYSNLELRVIAAYCGEPRLIEIFDKGLNVFDVMEADLGYPRDAIKTFYYATGYGAGDDKIKQSLGITLAAAQKLRATFFSTYAQIGMFKERVKKKAKQNLRIKLWTGRVRHFENSNEAGHLAFNSLIQGAGAELVKNRTIAVGKEIDWEDCRMLLQVHDSLVFEIRNGTEDEWLPRLKKTMEDVPDPLGKHVKFEVDIKKWGSK